MLLGMARVTAEMKIEIPPHVATHITDGKKVFFDTVETAFKTRFSDYFLKVEKEGLCIRCIVFLSTKTGTEEEAISLLKEMAEAVMREIQTNMSSKMS